MFKIIDRIKEFECKQKRYYSFEYFPPKTNVGLDNLYDRAERMISLEPLFCDVTWGAGGSTSETSIDMAHMFQSFMHIPIMLHLTCTNQTQDEIYSILLRCKEIGIQNILALRGDPPAGYDWKPTENGFNHASDLIKFIRKHFGDFFCIAVAGYPQGHIECSSFDQDILYLKEKVDSGADFVISQLFFDATIFLNFHQKCREIGIKCPIIPGILPIPGYSQIHKMMGIVGHPLPHAIAERIEENKNDDAAIKVLGINISIEIINELFSNNINGIHLYTMNLEKSVVGILEGLNLLQSINSEKLLPWAKSRAISRVNENVRPIFWHNRPLSYLQRTVSWDEFPNGRWGDARSPAFSQNNYYLLNNTPKKKQLKNVLLKYEMKSVDDISNVFIDFLNRKINFLPWCDNTLSIETDFINDDLTNINKKGFLTINSQPKVNGANSDDPVIGWGGKDGYVYQKAYLEFFCSPEHLEALLKACDDYPRITLQALNNQGNSYTIGSQNVNAVTWGCFPGKEIIQPTIVDFNSFSTWKEEAFSLWIQQWASLYSKDSPSYKLIEHIFNTYFLVNMVDNDFVKGDIYKVVNNAYDFLHSNFKQQQ